MFEDDFPNFPFGGIYASCLAGSYVASPPIQPTTQLWVSNLDELCPVVTLSTTSLLPVSGTAGKVVTGTASTVAWLQ